MPVMYPPFHYDSFEEVIDELPHIEMCYLCGNETHLYDRKRNIAVCSKECWSKVKKHIPHQEDSK